MRRGMLKEIEWVFDLATDMVGGMYDPDTIVTERAKLEALRKEVIQELQGRASARRVPERYPANQCHTLGYYSDKGGWISTSPLFRTLSPPQVRAFHKYAQENPPPDEQTVTHPTCRNVWAARQAADLPPN